MTTINEHQGKKGRKKKKAKQNLLLPEKETEAFLPKDLN